MKPNIAFFICCIGMGHFTQAITVENYIKDKYNFKYIFCSCTADVDDDEIKNRVKNSILYKDKATIQIGKAHMLQTHELTNMLKTQANILYYSTKHILLLDYAVKKYNISLCLDFFTNFYDVFRYPTISISRQFISMEKYLDNPIHNLLRHSNHINAAICLSKDDITSLKSCSTADTDMPPLISLDNLNLNRPVIPDTCLVYSRDAYHCDGLNRLIKNNPNISFSVFTNHLSHIKQSNNVVLSKPSNVFKEKLETAQFLITRPGVEGVCESYIRNIRIIVFKPNNGDKEQLYNYNCYIEDGMAIAFSSELDLHNLSTVKQDNKWLIEYCKTAEKKINKLIDKVIDY